jgi:flagellar hook assembly protein FlgD
VPKATYVKMVNAASGRFAKDIFLTLLLEKTTNQD